MRMLILGLSLLVCLTSVDRASADSTDKIALKVLYLAREDAKRTASFADYLSQKFEHCRVAQRSDFDATMVEDIDVVLVDWPQGERNAHDGNSPLGPVEEWSTPTVFLGSAGLLMADAWGVIGDAG